MSESKLGAEMLLFVCLNLGKGGKVQMVKALSINLEIDYNRTRVAVEKFMENYEHWKIKIDESKIPMITTGCILEFAGTSRGYVVTGKQKWLSFGKQFSLLS